jgi:hypothetical protein
MADNPQSQARPIEVRRALPPSPSAEVRRALPAVPRALSVTSQTSTFSNARWQPIRMPDGTIVEASYQGELPNSAALPPQGRFIGENAITLTAKGIAVAKELTAGNVIGYFARSAQK